MGFDSCGTLTRNAGHVGLVPYRQRLMLKMRQKRHYKKEKLIYLKSSNYCKSLPISSGVALESFIKSAGFSLRSCSGEPEPP